MVRKLPVYILLDCSESMAGPGIEGLRLAVGSMITALRRNPYALETVWVSFISFSGEAHVLAPLCPLDDIQEPRITIAPGTALGAALRLTAECIKADVRKGTQTQKGDFRPIVFIITDGIATDNCDAGARALRTTKASIHAVGCGHDIDWHQLGKVTESLFNLADPDGPGLASAFKWVSGSIASASSAPVDAAAETPGAYQTSELPEGLEPVDLAQAPRHGGKARQVFIQAWCQQHRLPYLMRFGLTGEGGTYAYLASHRLEGELGRRGESALPPIDNSQLSGNPSCAYCEAGGVCHCEKCRSLFCIMIPASGFLRCPCCGHSGRLDHGSFNIDQRAG